MKCTMALCGLISLTVGITGCNSGQIGAGAGAGIGALAGQAIGGNTSSTLIGAGAGAAAGYMVGNEMDKQKAEEDRQRMQREIDANRRNNRSEYDYWD